MRAYEWLDKLGLPLRDNEGVDIKASRAGRAKPMRDYLSTARRYHQIVDLANTPEDEILAVVDDTQIVVAVAHRVLSGRLVVLPPPDLSGSQYPQSMSRLIEVAHYFYGKATRQIPLTDTPQWLGDYLTPHHKDLDIQIDALQSEKARLDQIAYVLYGTGETLELSVATLLEDIGLTVERLP